MTTIHEIEKAVANLPANKLKEFRSWFEQFDAKEWDDQFEENVKSGKLDEMANEAREEDNKG